MSSGSVAAAEWKETGRPLVGECNIAPIRSNDTNILLHAYINSYSRILAIFAYSQGQIKTFFWKKPKTTPSQFCRE